MYIHVTTVHNCTSRTDDYNECELFDETTTVEVSEDEDRGKRPLKKKSFGTDFVSGKLVFFPFNIKHHLSVFFIVVNFKDF